MYSTPRAPYPPAGPQAPLLGHPTAKRYKTLRFLASSCIVSAWLSLGLSLLFGIGAMISGVAGLAAPTAPSIGSGGLDSGGLSGGGGLDGLGGGGAGAGGLGLGGGAAAGILAAVKIATGVFTIGSGVMSFFLLMWIGLQIYVLIDTEENTRMAAAAMTAIARKMGIPGI